MLDAVSRSKDVSICTVFIKFYKHINVSNCVQLGPVLEEFLMVFCQVATQWPDLTNADTVSTPCLKDFMLIPSGLTRLFIGVHWVNIAPAKSSQFSN